MAKYLVRIELHRAGPEDYERLHESMDARGFSREIRGSDGVIYQLPTAEYVTVTSAAGPDVRSAAKAAADETGHASGVIVVEYSEAWWIGLSKAR